MRKYYTRACNFYHGSEAIKINPKKKALPLNGKKKILPLIVSKFFREKKRELKLI